ncbi:MAG: hypothetical protein J7L14_01845 [Candidatus Diapherotrites archaeon]|nr:hypothetical protein [Candidatus Diapherotrites archaeon]
MGKHSRVRINCVALDTSIILACMQFKVDIFSEMQRLVGNKKLVIPEQVKKELEEIKKESEIKKRWVIKMLEVMDKYGVETVKVEAQNADSALLKLAERCIIATADKELRKEIKKIRGQVIYLKGKKILEIE